MCSVFFGIQNVGIKMFDKGYDFERNVYTLWGQYKGPIEYRKFCLMVKKGGGFLITMG